MEIKRINELLHSVYVEGKTKLRFLAISYGPVSWTKDSKEAYCTYKNPTLYKTLRNAKRHAGDDGVVLVFDPSLLPVALPDTIVNGDDNDEYQFAERQMLIWTDIAERLARAARSE